MNQHIDNKLEEGAFGALLFKNSLAQELYKEYYLELTDAIEAKDKETALKLYNEFFQDIEDLKSEKKRWHKEFIDAQEELLAKYKREIDNLPDVENAVEGNDSSVTESWDEYDDDYYDLDDVEQDRMHAALYGGDRTYCDCGRRLVPDEDGYFYCPECN